MEERFEQLDGPTKAAVLELSRAFDSALASNRISLTLAAPWLSDCPLVYVNSAFCQATGYDPEEVLGRNCRFLQGRDDDARARTMMRHAIATGERSEVSIINYRKNGEAFVNVVLLSAIRNDLGKPFLILGSQYEEPAKNIDAGERAYLFEDGIGKCTTYFRRNERTIMESRWIFAEALCRIVAGGTLDFDQSDGFIRAR